jgi:hypothetical protein
MRVSILGSGDISRICRHTNMKEEEVYNLLKDIGKILAKFKAEGITGFENSRPMKCF